MSNIILSNELMLPLQEMFHLSGCQRCLHNSQLNTFAFQGDKPRTNCFQKNELIVSALRITWLACHFPSAASFAPLLAICFIQSGVMSVDDHAHRVEYTTKRHQNQL